MNAPTPEEAREALDKLVVYANNGWGSACPGEVDTLRRFIDAHSAPVQPEPVALPNCTVADVGFRWDGDKQEHIPQVLVSFTPVPANRPNDDKGWKDRDAFAGMLASPPPAQPAPDMADAYAGAREDLSIWKRRALEAEKQVRHLTAALAEEVNGPTFMGEPVLAQPKREPLTDEDIKAEFAKLYPKDIGILELAEHNPDYKLEAIGARHHWAAFLGGARTIERLITERMSAGGTK